MEVGGTLGSKGLVKGRVIEVLFKPRLERREGGNQEDINKQRWSLKKTVLITLLESLILLPTLRKLEEREKFLEIWEAPVSLTT